MLSGDGGWELGKGPPELRPAQGPAALTMMVPESGLVCPSGRLAGTMTELRDGSPQHHHGGEQGA